MAQNPPCPQCHNSTALFEAGTHTPDQFFLTHNEYKIAASDARQRLPIFACEVCGHGFTPLNITASQISRWYQANAPDQVFVADEKARRRTARAILRRIEAYVPARGQLVDVGSGPGIFVSEAARHGWNATGLEPSSWATEYGHKQYGVEIKQGEASDLQAFSPQSVDTVTMFDVIEHVADPHALIHATAKVLRPGGLLVLTTPRFDSMLARLMGRRWYCIFPAHIQYFTTHSLITLLESAGFDILSWRTHTRYLGSRYLWQRLKAFLSDNTNTLTTMPDHSPIIPVNFGDEFEVYARKHAA